MSDSSSGASPMEKWAGRIFWALLVVLPIVIVFLISSLDFSSLDAASPSSSLTHLEQAQEWEETRQQIERDQIYGPRQSFGGLISTILIMGPIGLFGLWWLGIWPFNKK